MDFHLVDENQRLGIQHGGYGYSPGRSLELVSLCGGASPLFRVEPIRAMARHMVDLLTVTPLCMQISENTCLLVTSVSRTPGPLAHGHALAYDSSSIERASGATGYYYTQGPYLFLGN